MRRRVGARRGTFAVAALVGARATKGQGVVVTAAPYFAPFTTTPPPASPATFSSNNAPATVQPSNLVPGSQVEVNSAAAGYSPAIQANPQPSPQTYTSSSGTLNLPGPGWPAEDSVQSHAAWSGGHQPESLELWPKTESGHLAPCWETVVLADTRTGWPGKCLGLSQVGSAGGLASCASTCAQNPRCSVWQFTNNECWQETTELTTYSGTPSTNCEGRFGEDITIEAAQRLQHGAVRILRDISDIQVLNLYPIGVFEGDTAATGEERCRRWCYSYIACQYWQYGEDGCWLEVPETGYSPDYPLTSDGIERNSVWARTVRAGEYIQHFCPERIQPTMPPAVDECAYPASFWEQITCSNWKWLLLAVPIVVAAILCVLCRRPQKKRALKLREPPPPPPPEPEPPVVVQTFPMVTNQPATLVSQPSFPRLASFQQMMVNPAAPPLSTYAAVPAAPAPLIQQAPPIAYSLSPRARLL